MQRSFSECELGALPPLGPLLGAPVFVDPEVLEHDTVMFAAGTQTQSIKARCVDLVRGDDVQVIPLTRPD